MTLCVTSFLTRMAGCHYGQRLLLEDVWVNYSNLSLPVLSMALTVTDWCYCDGLWIWRPADIDCNLSVPVAEHLDIEHICQMLRQSNSCTVCSKWQLRQAFFVMVVSCAVVHICGEVAPKRQLIFAITSVTVSSVPTAIKNCYQFMFFFVAYFKMFCC